MKRTEIKALNRALQRPDLQAHINRKTAYWKNPTSEILYRWIMHWITNRISRELLEIPLSKLLLMSGTFEPTLVITIKDGVVDEALSFLNNASAEKYYKKVCLDNGAIHERMNDYLDDGYYMWTGGSVCITHPKIN